MQINADGLRVVVTAAGRGLGAAISAAFANAGARVCGCDVDLGDAPSPPAGVDLRTADVADEHQVRDFFGAAREHLGGIDVLVNNAGIAGPTGGIETLELDAWRRCQQVNLDGMFLCIREVVPGMRAQRAGSIVNIASTAGLFGYPLRTPYAASKWAVIGLTRSLAMELGPDGIRVNALCPGSLTNPRMDQVIANEARARGLTEDQVRAGYLRQTSLRTFIRPEEIADLALFICSPYGSRISGQSLSVDGNTETLGM